VVTIVFPGGGFCVLSNFQVVLVQLRKLEELFSGLLVTSFEGCSQNDSARASQPFWSSSASTINSFCAGRNEFAIDFIPYQSIRTTLRIFKYPTCLVSRVGAWRASL
jgi:hypothetical protein